MMVIAESISSVMAVAALLSKEEKKQQMNAIMENVIEIVDNLMNPSAYEKWQQMSQVYHDPI